MAFTYTLATDVGKIRLMIPDRVEAEAIFQDDELETFLALEDGVLKCAAACALETIAADEALVQKVQETEGLKTDGAKTATALLARAKTLREQAAAAAAAALEDDGAGYFDIAELVFDPFSARERRRNEALRSG